MSTIDRPWDTEVFYHIFPRSYRDSNGDGNGDFKGIEQGLDSIKKLGCTTILLNPIYKSRVYHNYFADDWFDVDPKFGTLADFRELCAKAHDKGIRIVLDMEPQYIADDSDWYKAAVNDPNSKEAGYFTAKLKKEGAGKSPWYNKAPVHLASLNLNNPDVIKEITRNFRFWCDQGVDGFRIDHMMDDLDWAGKTTNIYRDLWSPLETEIKRDYPHTFFIGEQAEWESFRACLDIYKHTPTDATFNFRLLGAFMSMKRVPLEKSLNEYNYFTPEGRVQANFLENHDIARFASAEPDPRKQRAAAAILMAARGIPSIYYGQELGMKGIQGHWNSDGNDVPVRLGYRWGSTLDAPGTAIWYKNTGPWWSTRFSSDHDGISYEEQDTNSKSLLNWYRKLIHLRKDSEALSGGKQEVVDLGEDQVLSFVRSTDHQKVHVLTNLSDHKASVILNEKVALKDLILGKKYEAGTPISLNPWQTVYLAGQK